MELNKSDIEKSLLKKGFVIKDGDHEFFHYRAFDGSITRVRTKLSRGSKKGIGDVLISQMSEQCKLSKARFVELVRCTLDQDGYEKILRESGVII